MRRVYDCQTCESCGCFTVTLPTNDDLKWEEQLIQADIDVATVLMASYVNLNTSEERALQYLLNGTKFKFFGQSV